jgi:predicted aspartyl protease
VSVPFDAQQGLITVPAELWGPTGSVVLRLALDTGATRTLVNVGLLVALGYDPALAAERIQVTTGSGVEFAPRLTLSKLAALGRERNDFRCWVTPCHPVRVSTACWV